jgi:hypothetical protein
MKLLAQLRDVDDPTHAERSSGDAAVRRILAAQGIQDLPRLRPLAPNATSQPLAARSGAAIKLAWLVGVAFVATLGLFGVEAWRSTSQVSAPTLRVDAPTSAPSLDPAPQPEATASAPVEPSSAPAASAPHPRPDKPAQDSLAEELRFLSSVDAEIRNGAYDSALQRLQQHKGTSALREERAAMRVLALCGRNPDGHALREREHFLKRAPRSILAASVRSACTGVAAP